MELDINDLGLTDYTVRPLAMADARAVFELMAAGELETIGEVAIEEADIISDWQRPSFDLAAQTIGVLDRDGGSSGTPRCTAAAMPTRPSLPTTGDGASEPP